MERPDPKGEGLKRLRKVKTVDLLNQHTHFKDLMKPGKQDRLPLDSS
ncbi:hypothetical protein [Leptothermofonsia sp. ETS-13]